MAIGSPEQPVLPQVHAPQLAKGQDPGTQQRAPWLTGVFDGSSGALREGLESLCSFIGIKVRMS